MRHLVFWTLLIASVSIYGDEGPNAQTLSRLVGIIESIDAFSAELEQTTLEPDGFLLDTQTGNMHFASPNLLRWETEDPFVQTLVADGSKIYLHDPDLNQVTIRSWSSDPTINPVSVFMAPEQLGERFEITEEKNTFYLNPLSVDATFQQLRLAFRRGLPKILEIDDNLGQTTRIEFSKVRDLSELDSSLFQFDIPEGAEIFNDG